MGYDFEVEKIKPQKVATIRDKVTFAELGDAFGKWLPEIAGLITQEGAQTAGMPYGRYYSFSMEAPIDLEAGIPFEGDFKGNERVKVSELPGGPTLTGVHVGPYEGLHGAHDAINEYAKNNNLQVIDAPWEVYVTDPGEQPDQSKWETKLFYPVK